jgi:hypothetical protein
MRREYHRPGMASVRFVVARRGRVEVHERPGPDLFLGRGPRADLTIDDDRLAERHVHVLVRRGRILVTDLGRGRAGLAREDERVRAPITVAPDEVLRLNDLRLSFSLADPDWPSLVGAQVDGARVAHEHATPDRTVRAFRLADERWITVRREPRSVDDGLELFDGRIAVVESEGPQIPATALFDALEAGLLTVPAEVSAVLACHLAEGVAQHHARRGPHGAIEPRRLHLGLDGSVRLWSPGPDVDLSEPLLDPFLAPERRYGLLPSLAADAYAVGVLARRLLAPHSNLGRLGEVLTPLFATRPQDRPRDLKAVAGALADATAASGLDATYQHAARAIRAIAGPMLRPIVRESAGASAHRIV